MSACVANDGLDDEDAGLADQDDDDEDDEVRGGAVRVCSGCTYKSKVDFSGLPTSGITSATMEVKVTHSGACPQSGYPNNCTEVLQYNVLCKLGASSSLSIPFFIDAATSNTSHSAKIVVVTGSTTSHTGSVDQSSNVTGGAAPPSSIPTPCPTPYLDPYSTTVPTVQ